jgi:hypothetical protein
LEGGFAGGKLQIPHFVRDDKLLVGWGRECPASHLRGSENKPDIAALKRCATQNQQPRARAPAPHEIKPLPCVSTARLRAAPLQNNPFPNNPFKTTSESQAVGGGGIPRFIDEGWARGSAQNRNTPTPSLTPLELTQRPREGFEGEGRPCGTGEP